MKQELDEIENDFMKNNRRFSCKIRKEPDMLQRQRTLYKRQKMDLAVSIKDFSIVQAEYFHELNFEDEL